MSRRPDAMLFPTSLIVGETPEDRAMSVIDQVRNTLCELPFHQYVHTARDGFTRLQFVRLVAEQHLYYPKGHPRDGQSRYEWYLAELKDGRYESVMPVDILVDAGHVFVGYLRDDPDAEDPSTTTRILAQRVADFKASPEYLVMRERINSGVGVDLA